MKPSKKDRSTDSHAQINNRRQGVVLFSPQTKNKTEVFLSPKNQTSNRRSWCLHQDPQKETFFLEQKVFQRAGGFSKIPQKGCFFLKTNPAGGFTRCYTPLFLSGFISAGLDSWLMLFRAKSSALELISFPVAVFKGCWGCGRCWFVVCWLVSFLFFEELERKQNYNDIIQPFVFVGGMIFPMKKDFVLMKGRLQ